MLGVAAFAVMAATDQTYVPSAPFSPQGEPNREVAVVYYSRPGHSEAAAGEIARKFNAPIARIDADYPPDFSGQGKALSEARAQAHPPIRIEPIELASARRVFLVSPIWLEHSGLVSAEAKPRHRVAPLHRAPRRRAASSHDPGPDPWKTAVG